MISPTATLALALLLLSRLFRLGERVLPIRGFRHRVLRRPLCHRDLRHPVLRPVVFAWWFFT